MYIFICVLALIIIYLIVLYNVALSKKNKMLKAYSSLDVMLKKRYDLIPNIVNAVKGYKEYEAETLTSIIALRKKADEDKTTQDLNDTANMYSSFVKDINILREQYPELVRLVVHIMHMLRVLIHLYHLFLIIYLHQFLVLNFTISLKQLIKKEKK